MKPPKHGVTIIRILMKKKSFLFLVFMCTFKKQNHQKLYVKIGVLCFLEICAIDPL